MKHILRQITDRLWKNIRKLWTGWRREPVSQDRGNQPESAENWSELAAALDQFDQGSANELIDKMEETVSGEEKEALKKMKDAIELFDFLTATEILQSLGGKEND